MKPTPTKALYYPAINFQSLEWLKSALLYWEGIKRIVPYDGDMFRNEVYRLKEEYGIYNRKT